MYHDIWYNIGTHLDYDTLLILPQINHQLIYVYNSNYFWLLKCQKDFTIKEEKFDEIVDQLKSGRETYLFWAGINDIPLRGAERYGNLSKLTVSAAASGDNCLIEYYHNLLPYEIFHTLGEYNNGPMINKLLNREDKFHYHNLLRVLRGALMANHEELIKILAPEELYSDVVHLVHPAIVSNNLSNLMFLINKYQIDLTNKHFLYEACAAGNREIINYLLENGATDYDYGLLGAAYRGDRELINLMIRLGATDVNGAMEEASQCGHVDIVLDMIKRGATDVDKALAAAATGGKLEIVKMLIDWGATNYTEALEDAAENGHLSTVKYLLSKPTSLTKALNLSVGNGNIDVFTLLMAHVGPLCREVLANLLKISVKNGHLLICRHLINLGADPLNPSLICLATSHNQLNIIIELINHGANYLPVVDKLKSQFRKYLIKKF